MAYSSSAKTRGETTSCAAGTSAYNIIQLIPAVVVDVEVLRRTALGLFEMVGPDVQVEIESGTRHQPHSIAASWCLDTWLYRSLCVVPVKETAHAERLVQPSDFCFFTGTT